MNVRLISKKETQNIVRQLKKLCEGRKGFEFKKSKGFYKFTAPNGEVIFAAAIGRNGYLCRFQEGLFSEEE